MMFQPFTDDPQCEKCLSKNVEVTHMVNHALAAEWQCPPETFEHLSCHCQRCHYIWEMDCANAVKKLEAAK